ncbi:MAG: FkbM family methyltransferase [Phycisphaeraceae bacterium]|nr:MAG: FkbM family methyltransferase [Phycisphaeraceae bacterium]
MRQQAVEQGSTPGGTGAGNSTALRRAIAAVIGRGLRFLPIKSGVGKLAGRIPRLHAQAPTERFVITRLRTGERIVVNPHDLIGGHVYWTGDYDRKISWLCRRTLRSGDTALDIGANNGVVALAMASAVGPDGSVHAVEPQPELTAALRDSAALNGFTHLHVHEIALSDTDGTAVIHIPRSNSGEASLGESRGERRGVEVALRHAGAFLESLGPARLRLMKIDVENHEAQVLGAALETLQRNPPDVIIFESHNHGAPFWEREAVRILHGLGYRLHQVPKALLRMRLDFFPQDSEPPHKGWDFVAIAPGEQREALERRLRVRSAPRR